MFETENYDTACMSTVVVMRKCNKEVARFFVTVRALAQMVTCRLHSFRRRYRFSIVAENRLLFMYVRRIVCLT